MGWIAWMAAGVLCLLLLWVLAIRPCRRREEEMQRFAAQYYAHRGLHNEAEGIPENSMGAFACAVAEGYGIELDVHLSRDGEAVVFHDDNLRRMCGVDACVTDLSWAELSKLHLRGTEYTIPRFSDVLALVGGKVPLEVRAACEKAVRDGERPAGGLSGGVLHRILRPAVCMVVPQASVRNPAGAACGILPCARYEAQPRAGLPAKKSTAQFLGVARFCRL